MPAAFGWAYAWGLSQALGFRTGARRPREALAPVTAAERGAHDQNIGLSQSFSNSAGRPANARVLRSFIRPDQAEFRRFR
jgi:hypothetical protein